MTDKAAPPKKEKSGLPKEEQRRRRREFILIVTIIPLVGLLTMLETRIVDFGGGFPISNTILMFGLININLMLLLLLIFLVFRNLVKLYYDRKRQVTGARLRTRLVVAFISMTLLPTLVLFFFSIHFISNSIAFWFNAPVDQALDNALSVGRQLYGYMESANVPHIRKLADLMEAEYLLEKKAEERRHAVLQQIRDDAGVDSIEIYSPGGRRIDLVLSPDVSRTGLPLLSPDNLMPETSSGVLFWSVSMTEPDGEWVRTLGTVPFGVSPRQAGALIVFSRRLPAILTEDLMAIAQGVEEYRQTMLLKKPVEITYYIALSIVSLLVIFCAIWYAFYLAKTITNPIMDLAEGTRRVADGDFTIQLIQTADDEIGSLVNSFNQMIREIGIAREQLSLSARMLRQQNSEIEERRRYMEIILKNISTGVISLDSQGRVTTMNTSAERMLGVTARDTVQKHFRNLIPDMGPEVVPLVRQRLQAGGDHAEVPIKLTIQGQPRQFVAHFNVLKDENRKDMGVVMVFDDVTELEKAQRMAAWREVARRIAHEVKNPLTPLSLSAQRLRRKFAHMLAEPVFDECTRTIIDHVDLIRNLVNEFSTYARFPTANPKPCSMGEIIQETLSLYREGEAGISITEEIELSVPLMDLDRQQIKQALINLMDNAISAMNGHGDIRIHLSFDSILGIVRLEVADTGPGISDNEKTRLFEPYFSTKKTGMGLGLTIVNSIVTDHKGSIRVQDNPPRGAKFVMEFPVQRDSVAYGMRSK